MSDTPAMRHSLFHSGLAPRLGAAALYGLVAFGGAALLGPDDRGNTHAAPAEAAPVQTGAARATLCIESLQPVASWEVRVDGAPVAAARSDGTTWLAGLTLAPEATLVIDATPAGGTPAGRNALRIRLAGTPVARDQTFWCERDWTVTARAARLAPSAAPIDPADLP